MLPHVKDSDIVVVSRRLRKDGSVGIPASMRKVVGMVPGYGVDVEFSVDRKSVVITPNQIICRACQQPVAKLDGDIGVCPDCMEKIMQDVRNGETLHNAIAKNTVKSDTRKRK